MVGASPETARPVLSELADPDTARLERSIVASENGQTIGALIRANEETGGAALIMEIKYCAITYCASPNTEPETLKESARFVISQYSGLNFHEIREAFRFAAAWKIDASLAAYHGQFSVRILGDVLSTYSDYRTQAARQVRARIRAQESERENAERAEAMRQYFGTLAEQFQALVEQNTKYQRWQDLPGWFCERLVREDIPGFSLDEKAKTWVTAKHWAVNRLGAWILNPETAKADRERYRKAKAKTEKDPDFFPDEIMKEAQEAYAKMLVFNRIAPFQI